MRRIHWSGSSSTFWGASSTWKTNVWLGSESQATKVRTPPAVWTATSTGIQKVCQSCDWAMNTDTSQPPATGSLHQR